MAGRKKALGLYDQLSDEGKKVYDEMIAKSFRLGLDKFTKREIDYLIGLYERKVNEIVEGTKELDTKAAEILAVYTKLKSYTYTEKYKLIIKLKLQMQ